MSHANPGVVWAFWMTVTGTVIYGTPAARRAWTRAADRRAIRRVTRRDLASLDQADTFARAFGGRR